MPIKDPEKRREYYRVYNRMRRAGLSSKTRPNAPKVRKDPYKLKALQDLIVIMEDAINGVREDQLSTQMQKARTLAYCCSVSAKLLEMSAANPNQEESTLYDKDPYELIKDDPEALDAYFKMHELVAVTRRPMSELIRSGRARKLSLTFLDGVIRARKKAAVSN